MKTAKNNEISKILDELFSKSNTNKPVSVLFVSELDDDVRDEILSWCSKHKTYEGLPGYYYKTSNTGALVKTKDYGFDCSIEGHDVIYWRLEFGYKNDINFKINEVNAFKNLICKKGLVVDRDLRLAIYSVPTPMWTNNKPIFGAEEYKLFDEVILLELDNDVFKESFIKYYDEQIENIIIFENYEKKEEWLKRVKYRKEVGLYILNHPDFTFIPFYFTDEVDNILGGFVSNHFAPVDFYSFLSRIDDTDDIMKIINRDHLNITEAARKMLAKVFDGSNFCK